MTAPQQARSGRALLISLVVAVVAALGLLLAVGADPWEAARLIWEGAFGTSARRADTLMAWVPLVLASAGLVVTFAAGLWNIGVEGQIVAGAIAATLIARILPGPGWVVVPAALAAGVLGGIGWALIAGVLKTKGKVNEIFGGLGLDFVATGMTVYLIIGPWSREGVASTSGTDLFRQEAWLPAVGSTRLSIPAVILAIAAVVAVYYLMRDTMFGLRLKAVGRNPRSALLMGIPTGRYLLGAFAVGGALAGLAGAVQATGFHHKLVPAVSGGYGFLGILVVLLAGFGARWIAPISLFFVMVSIGSTQLELRLDLDSSIGDVLQGGIVFAVIFGAAWAQRRTTRPTTPAGEA